MAGASWKNTGMARPRIRAAASGLYFRLLAPLTAILLLAGTMVALLNWQADRQQAEQQARQRASAELGGIADQIEELRQTAEAYAQLLAADAALISAVTARQTVEIAQVLLPLKAKLELSYLFVYDRQRQPLLQVGPGRLDGTALALVSATRTTLTTSQVAVVPEGLAILAATPLRDQHDPEAVGTLVVGSVLGEAALRKVKEERPHLILLDIQMPKMDGLEVLRQVKAIDPTVNVIMATGVNE